MSSISTDHEGLDGIKIGDVYCAAFVKRLPEGVDAMGENGEFHTHVYHDKGMGSGDESEEDEKEEDSSELESEDDEAV